MATSTSKTLMGAECWTCGEQWYGKNAHGVAAKHAKDKGHVTSVTYELIHHYDYTEQADE